MKIICNKFTAIINAFILCLSTSVSAGSITAVDGDSLLRGLQRIRLDGIDAPEFSQICYTEDVQQYPCGEKAFAYLQNMVENTPTECKCLPEKDAYNRLVCECFADGKSLNRAMVNAGWAMTYRSSQYENEEIAAKRQRRGIWQGKFMRPALFRALERLKGNRQHAETTE